MLSRSRKRRIRVPLLLVLVCALAFRSVIPAGYMPVASEGGMHMALCPGMPMQDHTDHSGTSSSHADSGVCLFAASALPPLPAGTGALFMPVQAHAWSLAPHVSVALVSQFRRAQQARAPPDSQAI